MKIYLIKYHAKPSKDNNNSIDLGGAYINCWIESNNIESADKLARREIIESNWEILSVEDSFETDFKDYAENDSGLQYYKQALVDKQVIVFHTYPIE